LPPPIDRDVKLLVEEVIPRVTEYGPLLELRLEDGRIFKLYSIPLEIASAVNKLREGNSYPPYINRESVFDALVDLRDLIKDLLDKLTRVVINEMDPDTGLYTAVIEFNLGGIILRKKMIPSHATYLALLAEKPIYVSKRLVDEQELHERQMEELRDLIRGAAEEEGEEGEEEEEEE